jgi:plasmid stability protein
VISVVNASGLHYATNRAILHGKGVKMSILHVRSIPEELYQRLQQIAKVRNRSISAQVVEMLMQALENEERRLKQAATLNSIRRRRFLPPDKAPSSLDLLHEDRHR